MKFEEHKIVQQVMRSRQDPEAADQLIRSYMPFIKAETARFIHRPPVEGRDDELSVAMFAFYETMTVYNPDRGPFLPLAAAGIRNRLIDYFRKEQKHSGQLSLNQPAEEDGCLQSVQMCLVQPSLDWKTAALFWKRPIRELMIFPIIRIWLPLSRKSKHFPQSLQVLDFRSLMWQTAAPARSAPWTPA